MARPDHDQQRDPAAERERAHERDPAGDQGYDEHGDATRGGATRGDDDTYGDSSRGDAYGDSSRGDTYGDSSESGAAQGDPTTPSGLVDGSSELFERWQRVQSEFVDAPRESVHEAGGIVEDVLGRLSRTFEQERRQLDELWDSGEEPTTEELRRALRRYREFFERLLAA
jgi:hypothetical protein